MVHKHDIVVIGAGPGGYVAAIRAAQLGLNAACVERESALGGTCLRIGCIPSKALLESSERYHELEALGAHGVGVQGVELDLRKMLARKDGVVKALTQGVRYLFKKNGVTSYQGVGTIERPGRVAVHTDSGVEEIEARNVVIATGSKVAPLRGVDLDGDRVGTSTEALSYTEVPRHLVVIGAGAIGLELGSVWLRLGSKVTVLEYLDRILPDMDSEVASEARKIFAKQGLEIRLGCKVTSAAVEGDECTVRIEGSDPVVCDRVLLAVGRVPNTDDLGLASVGVRLDERGRVEVDEHYRTSVEGIHAIGDVIPGPMLAHKAEDEGIACVEHIATGYGHVNYDAIPGIVYTSPEVAGVGRTEDDLRATGMEYRKGSFPFIANGRARAIGHTEGRVKILADARTDRVLGVHILGPRAGDLVAEAAVAIEFSASAEDLARASHAHPTLSEVVREAAFGVADRSIHL